jgi:hypothetical protein
VLDVIHERLENEREYWVGQFIEYVQAWRRDVTLWERRMRLDDVPSPGALLRNREIDAARTFGTCQDPDDFVRRFTGVARAEARRAVPVLV